MARPKRHGTATAVEVAQEQPAQAQTAPAVEPAALSYAERNNPERLEGQALRDLAYQMGLSRSESGRMSDPKVREQLRFIAYRQYDR